MLRQMVPRKIIPCIDDGIVQSSSPSVWLLAFVVASSSLAVVGSFRARSVRHHGREMPSFDISGHILGFLVENLGALSSCQLYYIVEFEEKLERVIGVAE